MTETLTPNPAHGVRPAAQAARLREPSDSGKQPARPAILAPSDPIFAEIIAALSATPLLGFDMGATVIVGDAGVEGRVWVRANVPAQAASGRAASDSRPRSKTWTLTSLDASLIALLIRLQAFRGAEMFADAFVQASLQAERRVTAVHAWSGQIRPTEDGE